MLFTWNTSGSVEYNFHTSPDGAPAGHAESFDAHDLGDARGAYTAPFIDIHGRYSKNTGTKEITITLHTAGFYTNAHGGRSRASVYPRPNRPAGTSSAQRPLSPPARPDAPTRPQRAGARRRSHRA